MTDVTFRLASRPRRTIGLAAVVLALLAVGIKAVAFNVVVVPPWALDPTDPEVTLSDVEREVDRYYGKPAISAADVRRRLRLQAARLAIFDVRSAEEFAAGHIPGAIHIDPDMSAANFLETHADKLNGREVIFYCAVGVRSAVMMQRLASAQRLPPAAYNLRGGIFRWVADGGSLVAASGPGVAHPYDPAWGQLLRRETAHDVLPVR